MLTPAIAAAISAFVSATAGTALGLMVFGSRFRSLRQEMDQVEEVIPFMAPRQEVAQMFQELAIIEEQRHMQAQMQRQQVVPFPMAQASVPAPAPGPSPQELNDLLAQQLASLNARLQQVNGRRVAQPPAGYSQPSAG